MKIEIKVTKNIDVKDLINDLSDYAESVGRENRYCKNLLTEAAEVMRKLFEKVEESNDVSIKSAKEKLNKILRECELIEEGEELSGYDCLRKIRSELLEKQNIEKQIKENVSCVGAYEYGDSTCEGCIMKDVCIAVKKLKIGEADERGN